MQNLVHNAGSAIMVSTNTGVQSITQARLVKGVGVIIDAADARVWSASLASDVIDTSGVVSAIVAWKDLLNGGCELLVVWFWRTLILLVGMSLAATKITAGLIELIKGLHWQSRHAVVLCSSMVRFVNRNRRVNDFGLDCFLIDNWLYCLMHVVMDMLADCNWGSRLRLSGLLSGGGVLELAKLGAHPSMRLCLVVVLELPFNLRNKVMSVLLGKCLFMSDWLNSSVIVMLMDFSVNGLCAFLMAMRLDGFRGDCWAHVFIDIGSVTGLARELVDGVSGSFHIGYD